MPIAAGADLGSTSYSVGNGPRGSSTGSFGDSGGDRGVGGGGLLAVLLALLIGGANNNNNSGNGNNKRGCLGRLLVLGLIVVGAVLLLNMCSGNTQGGLLSSLLGDYTATDSGLNSVETTDSAESDSSGSVTDALGSLLGNYGSTTGQIAPVSSAEEVYQPHEPDRDVASAAREKFTDVANAETVTVMVYLCGTDLESKSGMATADLEEMLNATLSDKINVIVETGGTSNWQNQLIKSNTNQRFRVKQGGLETLNAKVASAPWWILTRSRISSSSARGSSPRIVICWCFGITAVAP